MKLEQSPDGLGCLVKRWREAQGVFLRELDQGTDLNGNGDRDRDRDRDGHWNWNLRRRIIEVDQAGTYGGGRDECGGAWREVVLGRGGRWGKLDVEHFLRPARHRGRGRSSRVE